MTASEPPAPPELPRSVERAVELLVYLPVGVIASAVRTAPALASSQRATLRQQLGNAQVVGRFAVDLGWRQLRQRFERSSGTIERITDDRGDRPLQDTAAPHLSLVGHGPSAEPEVDPYDPDEERSRVGQVDAVIPDYDTLAASQVVRRLDGLATQELYAVAEHEARARHRRTILHRIDQLISEAGSRAPR